MEVQSIIVFSMELIGTIAFAASGAMTGINGKMDIFGVCVLGVITAVGGGIARDVILGNVPGALTNPVYVAAALFASLIVFALLYFRKNLFQGKFGVLYDKTMLVMDSIGLGIFTAVGVMTGIHEGYVENTFLLVVLGTLTGVGGGPFRGIMAGQPPYIFVKHVYACASVIGAVSCVWIYRETGQIAAMSASSAIVIIIRFLAAYYHWNLPRIKLGDS